MIRILSWEQQFENADTRKRERLKSFHAPSGCDSTGYLELAKTHGREGIQAFGTFQALCQLMATLPRHARKDGAFRRESGKPMTRHQLALKTSIPQDVLDSALDLLASPSIGWIQDDSAEDLPPSASNLPPSAEDLPPSASNLPPSDAFVQGEGEGEGEVFSLSSREGDMPGEIPPVTIDAAISHGQTVMITEDVVRSWWHARDAVGWLRKEQPILRWISDLQGYAANWKRNEKPNKPSVAQRDRAKTGLPEERIEVPML